MIKTLAFFLLIWSGYKFCKEIYLLIASFFEQLSYNNSHCPDCGGEYYYGGYYDEKRFCPKNCSWRKMWKAHEKREKEKNNGK